MYRRITEQVVINILASSIGMLSVLLIVKWATKNDYGLLVSSIAFQYVLSRLILSGVLL